MTLKRRISISIAFAFSIFFAMAGILIYFFFSSFRSEEFEERLSEKALTTAKLLLEVKEVDKQLLKLIDKNTLHKLYNEKILVFDENFNLIYSSIDDAVIDWDMEDLKQLKVGKQFFRKEGKKDVLGIFYDFEKTDYYVLVSAEDKYGNNKLDYLFYLLISTFCIGIFIIWLSVYFFIKQLLKPLDIFEKQITDISIQKLDSLLPENNQNNEINLLTKAFNTLLVRIDKAFITQREFSANASHELRTPLTRLSFQLENLRKNFTHTEEVKNYLEDISNQVIELTELVNSLLLLSKMNGINRNKQGKQDKQLTDFETLRIDEIIFSAAQQVKKQFPFFDFNFEIIENENIETAMEVTGIKSLFEIAFINLLKNACLYSHSQKAKLSIEQLDEQKILVRIFNDGKELSQTEQQTIFEPFMRGQNAVSKNGSGLGLRIVQRIFDYHSVSIAYSSDFAPLHCFEIRF